MKYIKQLCLLFVCAFIFSGCHTDYRTQLSYHGICIDDEAGTNGLYNPERGFRLEVAVDVNKKRDVWKPEQNQGITSHLESESLKYSSDSISLVQSYFYLHGFVGKTITEEAFTTMDTYFDKLRELGKKAVLRFAYETDFMGRASSGPTLEDVLNHMEQLKPFLEKNVDVIQVVQAGFIGAWGEWHSSLHGLEKLAETKKTILEKIVWMTPANRMVQVRLPEYKNLLQKESDFYKRTSFHDDFIIIEPHKWDGGMHEGTAAFEQMVNESPYLIVDGELPWGTWSVNQDKDNPEPGWIIDGKKVARQLFLQHYTSLSAIHNYKEGADPAAYSMIHWKKTPVTESFLKENKMPVSNNYFRKKDGSETERNVFDYIRDHLGYRLEIQQLKLDSQLALGKDAFMELSLINRGFSTLFNEHPVYFVLIDPQEQVTGFLTKAEVNQFQPYAPGDTTCTPLLHTIKESISVPTTLVPGKYKLGLWIPDGSEKLKYDSRYAIRCANNDVAWWVSGDGKYGVNILTEVEL